MSSPEAIAERSVGQEPEPVKAGAGCLCDWPFAFEEANSRVVVTGHSDQADSEPPQIGAESVEHTE